MQCLLKKKNLIQTCCKYKPFHAYDSFRQKPTMFYMTCQIVSATPSFSLSPESNKQCFDFNISSIYPNVCPFFLEDTTSEPFSVNKLRPKLQRVFYICFGCSLAFIISPAKRLIIPQRTSISGVTLFTEQTIVRCCLSPPSPLLARFRCVNLKNN